MLVTEFRWLKGGEHRCMELVSISRPVRKKQEAAQDSDELVNPKGTQNNSII